MKNIVKLVVTRCNRVEKTGHYRIDFETIQRTIQTTKGNLVFGTSKRYYIFSSEAIEVGAEFELDFDEVQIIETPYFIDKNNPEAGTRISYRLEFL